MRWPSMSRLSIFGFIFCAFLLMGCVSQPQEQPGATQSSSANSGPAASTCNPHDFIEQVKHDIPYSQVSLLHNNQYGLTLWAVDPTLESDATGDGAAANAARAAELAAKLTFRAVNDNSCMRTSFSAVTAIVVDSRYHAWFIGSVETSQVPEGTDLTDDVLAKFTQAFASSPFLQTPVEHPEPAVPPQGACTWDEVHRKLLSYFAPVGPNIDFYFVIDQDGANVWAQWEGPDTQQSPGVFLSGLLALQTELRCLNPPVDTLWMIYTDTDGVVRLIQSVDGETLRNTPAGDLPNHLQSIYPPPSS
jgi:hypothetical protein